MYLPPYQQLLRATHNAIDSEHAPEQVTISIGLFNFLLQVALASSDFDEERYLAANPEVRDHIALTGKITPNQHFIGFGYFEGRKGALPEVDELWYLETYPDVAAAIPNGEIASATEHFEKVGAIEGRAPSAEYVDVANQWKMLLNPEAYLKSIGEPLQ
jgi:hypothetical protein